MTTDLLEQVNHIDEQVGAVIEVVEARGSEIPKHCPTCTCSPVDDRAVRVAMRRAVELHSQLEEIADAIKQMRDTGATAEDLSELRQRATDVSRRLLDQVFKKTQP
jgi:transcriptional regulator GlxA family with amidase domain